MLLAQRPMQASRSLKLLDLRGYESVVEGRRRDGRALLLSPANISIGVQEEKKCVGDVLGLEN